MTGYYNNTFKPNSPSGTYRYDPKQNKDALSPNRKLYNRPMTQPAIQQTANINPQPVQYYWPNATVPSVYSVQPSAGQAFQFMQYYWPNVPVMHVNTIQNPYNHLPNQINAVTSTESKTTVAVNQPKISKLPFKNDLKQLFQTNRAIIEAIVIRTFGACDKDSNGIINKQQNENGTFLNAINRLDELKSLGINTLHVLPITKVGQINKLGEAGSIYAPDDYNDISTQYDTPNNGLSVKEEFQIFINEAHKRGIKIMVDLPSCGSIGMTHTHPDWFLRDRNGELKVPGDWKDIRMFDPYINRDTGELRRSLMDMHKQFIKQMIDLGVDGIRADVARAKPNTFWSELINYSHQLDPNFGWLAESYVHEDASPMANIPADRPEDLLKTGFDLYYGQWHILHNMKNFKEVNKYIIDNINMSNRLPKGKGMIGSFYTHDDKSVMNNGGPLYCKFASTLLTTLPMINPYYINGFETGDTKQLDIFNYVKAPKGRNPDIFYHVSSVNKMKEKYKDILGLGYYIPLNVKTDKDDQIMAFIRHLNGQSLLILANKDMNARHIGKVEIPTLSKDQTLIDLAPAYGSKSKIALQDNQVTMDLAPGRVHMFEINTPSITNSVKSVYRQNL